MELAGGAGQNRTSLLIHQLLHSLLTIVLPVDKNWGSLKYSHPGLLILGVMLLETGIQNQAQI